VALQTMTDDEGLSLREARRFGRRRESFERMRITAAK
jgi:hypothetical protein